MRRFAVLVPLVALGACAEAPFLDRGPLITLQKQGDLPHRMGAFTICYNDGDLEKVNQLARETCAQYGLVPLVGLATRDQCRLTAPQSQQFQCADPKMRFADGTYVNPFKSAEVRRWHQQQQRLAGGVGAPPSPSPSLPPLVQPVSPDQTVVPAPALPPPPEAGAFDRLPVGGWGQAWDVSP